MNPNHLYYNQEAFYNNTNNNNTNNNNTNNNNINTEINMYDNNEIITNYTHFINNYMNTLSNQLYHTNYNYIMYNENVKNILNELRLIHRNLDYYYYNRYRINNRTNYRTNNINVLTEPRIINDMNRLTGNRINHENQQEIENENQQEIENENQQENQEENEIFNVTLENIVIYNHVYYRNLSNINLESILNSETSNRIYNTINQPINDSCCITQNVFNGDDNVIIINTCQHIFYPNAFKNWFYINQTCPNCRCNLVNNNYIKVEANNNEKYVLTRNEFNNLLVTNVIHNINNRFQ